MAEHRQPVTKKQHYVPQLLLRHFAYGGSERINVFRITSDKLLRNQSVREQAHQNHFYGEQAIEKWLGSVETAAAPVIAGAVDREALPVWGSEGHGSLLAFAFLQSTRTPYAAGEVTTGGQLLSRRFGFPGAAEGEVNAPVLAMTATANSLHFVADLCCKLLCNRTQVPFVLSDHPAVRYNQFLEPRYSAGTTGLAARGFQLFLPLSPRHALVYFDQDVYKVGGRKPTSLRVDVTDAKDAAALNLLQAVSAEHCLYFDDEIAEADIRGLMSRAAKYRRSEKVNMQEFKPADELTGQQGVLLELHRNDVRTRLQLRCITISPHAGKYVTHSGPVPYRNPVAVAEYEAKRMARFGVPPIQPAIFVPVDGTQIDRKCDES